MRVDGENRLIGTIKSSKKIADRFGVGFEKLDRNAFDPSDKYIKLSALNVKHVRIQSGWERTEKQEGVYDFEWLETVVDKLSEHNMSAWICLCYGNPLYTEAAKKVFGSVGCPPIKTERERTAWANYCKAIARKFKGKVNCYEIWNEPDGTHCWKHGTSPEEYAEFVKLTVGALREVDKDLYIVGGALGVTTRWANWLKKSLDCGLADGLNAISYHRYTAQPESNLRFYEQLVSLTEEYKKLDIIHGESGCPSTIDGNGALHACLWNENKQAELLLRNMIVDLKCGVKFSSWFSAVDMMEGLFGTRDDVTTRQDYGYYGLFGAEFNENGEAIGSFEPKKSYYAFKNLAAVFGGEFKKYAVAFEKPVPLLWSYEVDDFDDSGDDLITVGFKRKNGAQAFVYYKPLSVLRDEYHGTVSFKFQNVDENIRIYDPLTGEIFEVNKNNTERLEHDHEYCLLVKHLPLRDYPLIVTFGDFIEND